MLLCCILDVYIYIEREEEIRYIYRLRTLL